MQGQEWEGAEVDECKRVAQRTKQDKLRKWAAYPSEQLRISLTGTHD